MRTDHPLSLSEEMMLLCLHDRTGNIATGWLAYALAGSVIAELLLAGRIRIEDEDRKTFLVLASDEAIGDPLLDDWLDKFATARVRATVPEWLNRIASQGRLKERIVQRLCDKNIVEIREDTILWVFTQKRYPEVDPQPEQQLVEQLRSAIASDDCDLDPRTVLLISLADSAGVLSEAIGSEEVKRRRERIDQIIRGDVVGSAAKEVIQQMQNAIMVAAVMPTIFAAASPP